MRITNSMVTNGMMLNINRNANALNKYYTQLSTGKKIQFPSDDPLLASRSLKFRTNVAETEQYMKNVSQGLSWMEVTEGAFRNVNNIMFKIRELASRGASDTLTYEDREKIMTDIASLTEQIGLEINVTYAGRYVFSGYRTDQPPVLAEDAPNLSYTGIEQYFDAKDVQYTKAYSRDLLNAAAPPGSKVHDVAVIKLAYTDLEPPINLTFDAAATSTYSVNVVSINDEDAYTQVGNYIEETGELVVGVPDVVTGKIENIIPPLKVTYDKTGFKKGELNPQIYFQCVDNTPNSPTLGKIFNPNGERQHFEFEFSVNTKVRVNSNAPDVFTDKMFADYQSLLGVVDYMNKYTKEEITTIYERPPHSLSGEALEDAVAQEMQKIQETAQQKFADLIGFCDKHLSTIGTEHTDLGSRMSRLELINTRLEDDRVSYTKLMSDNEDVDYAEAIMKLNGLESVYQASLKTGGSIMKLTLADFI